MKTAEHADSLPRRIARLHVWDAVLRGRARVFLRIAVFIAGAVGFGAYSIQLGPARSWDMRNYHYYSAYAWLNDRGDYDFAPAQIQSFLNPVSFVPFYLMASQLPPKATGFVAGAIHGLNFGLVFALALALFASLAPLARLVLAFSCAALGAYGPIFLSTLGTSHNESVMSLLVLAAAYVLVRTIVVRGSVGTVALVIAGVLLGVASGLKLTCLVFLIGCAAAVLVAQPGGRPGGADSFLRGAVGRIRATATLTVASVIGLLLARGFWMADLWSRFRNPVFPFYNKVFHSPYFHDINWADERHLPRSLGEALTYPFHFLVGSHITNISFHFRDARYAVIYVLLVVLIAVVLARAVRGKDARRTGSAGAGGVTTDTTAATRANAFIIIFFTVSYVVWQTQFSVIRYAVPLELLAPAVAATLAGLIFHRGWGRVLVTIAAFVVIAAVMRPSIVPVRGEWSSYYLSVDAPRFRAPERTLVIMANNEPWSYVIPFFQPGVRFVGLWNTFSREMGGRRHRALEEMIELVNTHRGPMFVLADRANMEAALEHIEPYGIVPTEVSNLPDCLPVTSRHDRKRFCLRPVAPMP